jgi:5,10-methylenetetrahydromethanopterin reductase
MRVGCTITPTPDAPQLARLAEELGYARVWVNDSPALYPDVWMTLARMAGETERIGLGPAVLVPGLRHPLTTAAAIATLEGLAPGRTAAVVGSGFTGRLAVGKRPATWQEIEDFVAAVRTLLRGEDVLSESGEPMRMMHPPAFVADRPVRTPILIAAIGPKGLATTKRIGDGVVSLKVPHQGFPRCVVSINGTVLRDGEDLGSERVLRAAGPGVAVAYHVAYALRGVEAASAMPLGARWVAQYEALDPRERQLALHEGHHAGINERDRMLMTPDALRRSSFTGTPEELRQRLRDLEAGGATEVTYHPSSETPVEELAAFAAMAKLADGDARL